jgi:hypothetical protein
MGEYRLRPRRDKMTGGSLDRRLTTFVWLLTAVGLLNGCAGWHWEKTGTSPDEYVQDREQCWTQASKGKNRLAVFAGCMKDKGWYRATGSHVTTEADVCEVAERPRADTRGAH